MTKLPWFPMYAQALLSDEDFQEWSPGARGCWLTLSARCWLDGSISADITRMAKQCNCSADAMREYWAEICTKYKASENEPGRLISARVEIERQNAIQKAESLTRRGKNGAKARWSKEKEEMPKQCPSNASAMQNDANIDIDVPLDVQVQVPLFCDDSQESPAAPRIEAPLRRREKKEKAKKAPSVPQEPSIREILATDGTPNGDLLHERFWHIARAFTDRNHKPREAAKLVRELYNRGCDIKRVAVAASLYHDSLCPENTKSGKDERQFQISMLSWLQQEGWESIMLKNEETA